MGYQIAAVIDWYGPYKSLEEARHNARKYYDEGIYMLIGRKKSQKYTRLQYVGVAEDLSIRLNNNHEKAKELIQEIQIWMGEIASTGVPGIKNKQRNIQIDLAEWAHAYFLNLPNNNKKTKYPPDKEVTVINRWWKIDLETPFLKRPHPDWPDIIDFKGEDYRPCVGWIKRKKIKKDDFQ